MEEESEGNTTPTAQMLYIPLRDDAEMALEVTKETQSQSQFCLFLLEGGKPEPEAKKGSVFPSFLLSNFPLVEESGSEPSSLQISGFGAEKNRQITSEIDLWLNLYETVGTGSQDKMVKGCSCCQNNEKSCLLGNWFGRQCSMSLSYTHFLQVGTLEAFSIH